MVLSSYQTRPPSIINVPIYTHRNTRGIRWNDPDIGVEWPVEGLELLLSEKDQKQPFLKDIKDTLEF